MCRNDVVSRFLHRSAARRPPTGLGRGAPETWFEVITGKPCPADAKNDFSIIGVAFDSSSRLRRAGVEYYHDRRS